MAFLEDSGWYKANYTALSELNQNSLQWGRGMEFLYLLYMYHDVNFIVSMRVIVVLMFLVLKMAVGLGCSFTTQKCTNTNVFPYLCAVDIDEVKCTYDHLSKVHTINHTWSYI